MVNYREGKFHPAAPELDDLAVFVNKLARHDSYEWPEAGDPTREPTLHLRYWSCYWLPPGDGMLAVWPVLWQPPQREDGKKWRPPTYVSEATRLAKVTRHEQTCIFCERTGTADHDFDGSPWQADHYIPTSRGGTDDRHNIVLSCYWCNYEKSSDLWTPGEARHRINARDAEQARHEERQRRQPFLDIG